jgi:hypothetical protein
MIDGAATATARKPRPSRKRLSRSCGALAAKLPAKPLSAIKARPPTASRQ